MREVVWTDERGYKRVSRVRDGDPDSLAQAGIPVELVNLDELDWDSMKRELHNLLVDRRLYDWNAVQAAQNGVTSAIVRVFKRPVVNLYRRR
jgi:hypothetical protein